MNRKIAVYPGSFDPITLGHLDVLQRAYKMFDQVILLISSSESKSYMFTPAERKKMAEEVFKSFPNITIDIHSGLTIEYARQKNVNVFIRGLRGLTDFEYEMAIAHVNRKLSPTTETIFVMASSDLGYISSKIVKEVAHNRGDITKLVPAPVVEFLKTKYPQLK